ncbi:hypothetical protein Sjap_000507 [Stephania japonica]|uniref:Uncharacterized protein n=1 Tax=Stephania japonica TaxID=461633 RepID=A0AAP0KI67_9MAGN
MKRKTKRRRRRWRELGKSEMVSSRCQVYWTGNGAMYRDLTVVLQKCFEMKMDSERGLTGRIGMGFGNCGGIANHHCAPVAWELSRSMLFRLSLAAH